MISIRRAIAAAIVAIPIIAASGGMAAAQVPFVPSLPASKTVIWALGDGANGSSRAHALGGFIASQVPDRFLYLGDVYPYGTADQFARNYEPIYGSMAAVTAPTPGNHEWANAQTGYLPYWQAKKGVPTPLWYSFEAGGWQIISLNSEAPHDPFSDQVDWLKRLLKSSKRRGNCRLAFWHKPLHSTGIYGVDTTAALWDPLRFRARLVVNGHEHNMQRFAPIDGITELISGAGGAQAHLAYRLDSRLRFADSTSLGALRIVLTRRLARFSFVAANGIALDSGRVRCNPDALLKRRAKLRK